MRKVTLYIAVSLDGYIADSAGGVEWIAGHEEGVEAPDTYPGFIKTVDAVILGWNTYHQVVTELSPDQWPYPEQTSYVVTHRPLPSTGSIKFLAEDPCEIVRKLKKAPGRVIWVCGGAGVIHPLIRAGLIDEYRISVIPTLLGSGIRLWCETDSEIKLELLHTRSLTGIIELTYTRRSL